MKVVILAALTLLSGCQSKLDKEVQVKIEAAKRRLAYYNSPEFKAKQKAAMDEALQWLE